MKDSDQDPTDGNIGLDTDKIRSMVREYIGMNILNTAEDALSNRYYGRERPAVIRQLEFRISITET